MQPLKSVVISQRSLLCLIKEQVKTFN